MGELARGTVGDRPWGRTLGALGLRGLTGQVTLTSDGKPYRIAFRQGAIVGASSPLATDSAVRLALTSNLISSTQVAEIARRAAAEPTRDEIEVLSDLVRLSPDQALKLRRRVVAQRAGRTFSIERGDFVVEDVISVPVVPGSELDIRAVIYLGARQNLSETRLATELGVFGGWFRLKQEAVEDLAQFGFSELERPILEQLLVGADLGELENIAPGLEQRMVRSVVYALISCGACDVESTARAKPLAPPRTVTPRSIATPPSGTPRVKTPSDRPTDRVPVERAVERSDRTRRASTEPPTTRPARATTATPMPSADDDALDSPTVARIPRARATRDPEAGAKQAVAIKKLIASRIQQLDKRADHFGVLGLPKTASADEIRTAYFSLARMLHPDKLTALGIVDEDRAAHKLFAQVNTSFAILADARTRAEYLDVLARGGEEAVRAEQARAEEIAMRAIEAENAFRRGEMALRRDQLTTAIAEFKKALELDPETADFQAMYAWAQFCASPDKMAAAAPTRAALDKAIAASPRAVTSYVVLGRVERMLGRDAEAARHFQQVLKLSPGHHDATSELRVIEARLARPPKR